MSADRILAAACARFPDRRALVFGGRMWTYRDLAAISGRLAADLIDRGVGTGDLVALLMRNRPEWLFWFLAVSRVGATAVPINPAYTAAEIASIVAFARPRLLVVDGELANMLDAESVRQHVKDVIVLGDGASIGAGEPRTRGPEIAGCPESARAVIYFSSGSTGSPKGVVHSRVNVARVVDLVATNWQLGPNDSILVAMPLAFVYASLVESLTAMSVGATIVLQERFRAEETLALIAAGRLTVIMGVPSMYRMLLAARGNGPIPTGSLRVCVTGGEATPPSLEREFVSAFGCALLDCYGLTEVPHFAAYTAPGDERARPLSCGRPLPGVETVIVDDDGSEVRPGEIGELLVRAPWTFLGYLDNPDATAAVLNGGWFRTGDLVRRDGDGFLYVVERKKDLIKRSGFNVLPGEVEEAILKVPGVAEAAVIGVADELRGQRVKAFVVREVAGRVTADDILAACQERLAKYKIPEEIEFLAELPKGPTGKVMKRRLRE